MTSAFLIVRDEAANLPGCLSSLSWADEIVVVDSGSKDDSIACARRFTDRVFERAFTNFADQKNFALSQVRGDWALSIDADERVSDALREEILATVASPAAAGYRVPRRNYFRGQWMRSFHPDYQTRLFLKDAARFVGDVHETVAIDGAVADLQNPLDHYGAPSIASLWRKIRRYAELDARKQIAAGESFRWRSLWARPYEELRRLLVAKKAYRDGVNGVLFAGMMALYAASVTLHGLREQSRR